MPNDFDFCFEQVIGHEGGYTTRKSDHGNWTGGKVGKGLLKGTKYGISAASYPTLDIKNLNIQKARSIYYKDYWTASGASLCDPGCSLVVFDAAVNAGNARARKWLQMAVGATPDGVLGPITRQALLKKMLNDDEGFLMEFQAQRTFHHMKIKHMVDEYGLGWSRRLCDVLMVATKRLQGKK